MTIKVLLVLTVCATAALWLSGCAVEIRKKTRPLVKASPLRKELELLMERRTDEQKFSSGKRKSESTFFQQRLRLETDGDIYHPNLLTYAAGVGLGLVQQSFDRDGISDSAQGSLNDYFLRTQFLKKKPLPLNMNLSQSEGLVPRQFQGPLRVRTSSTALSSSPKIPDWPMNISWSKTESDQNSDVADNTDQFTRDSERLDYSLQHDFSKFSHLSFDFAWDQDRQNRSDAITLIDSKQYSINHELLFGKDQQHRLNSYAFFRDDSGTTQTENLYLFEQLHLKHTSDFSTRYHLKYNRNKRESTSNDSLRGQAGFTHELYQSLVTNLDVFAEQIKIDSDQDQTQRGATLGLNYRKKNPWGVLSSSYSITQINDKNTGPVGEVTVFNERHVFTDPIPVELKKRNINISTIVVTDSSSLDVYTENDDYTITVTDGRVLLRFTPLGTLLPNVTNGQELLVSYLFTADPERTEKSLDQRFRITQQFKNGLTTYLSHTRRTESISATGATTLIPDEFETNAAGLLYNYKDFRLNADYSDTKSTFGPTESILLGESYLWRTSDVSSLALYASQNWLDIGGTSPRNTALVNVGGTFTSQLTRTIDFLVGSELRDEDDSVTGRTKGLKYHAKLQYDYRQLAVVLGGEFYTLDRLGTENTDTNIYLKLTRRF